jgi:hypothetical protein
MRPMQMSLQIIILADSISALDQNLPAAWSVFRRRRVLMGRYPEHFVNIFWNSQEVVVK